MRKSGLERSCSLAFCQDSIWRSAMPNGPEALQQLEDKILYYSISRTKGARYNHIGILVKKREGEHLYDVIEMRLQSDHTSCVMEVGRKKKYFFVCTCNCSTERGESQSIRFKYCPQYQLFKLINARRKNNFFFLKLNCF